MRMALLGVCVLAGTASAEDTKPIETEIRAQLDGVQTWDVSDGKPGWYDRLSSVKLGGPSGAMVSSRPELVHELVSGLDCPDMGMITWKLGTLTIGLDSKRGFAWFQAPVALDESCTTMGFAPPMLTDNLRVSGILTLENAKWHIVALALSRPFPDATLYKGATKSPAGSEPLLMDDSAPTKGAAAWFTKGGLVKARATGDVVASGTAPKEYATGAAATKLATAWGRLALHAETIEATTFASGAVALIRAEVPMPVKKKAAPMTLYAIAVLDGKTWRWVSLQFTSSLAEAPVAEVPDTSGIECPHGKC